jgi:ABC-type Mn2+/Zn2+ transport system permease subunit
MNDVLEVDKLSIQFGKVEVLRDVSFRLAAGTSLAVIGPNGCGKTVLFRALIGAIPFAGAIRWAAGVRFGYVPQKLASGEDLIDALFGHAGALSWPETVFGVSVSVAVVVFVVRCRHSLVVSLVSTDIARTAGIDTRRLDLLFLQMFAVTVALGLRYLGVLLMGSLIIIPAATAKRLSRNLTEMLVVAAVVAVFATVLGSYLAVRLNREAGSIIVTVAASLFLLTLLRRAA